MEKLIAGWRTEIQSELADEVKRREAALLELSEAQAAEREIAAALVEMQTALAALEARIDGEARVEMQGASVLHQVPAPLAGAIILRLHDLEDAAKSARSRTSAARRAVDQTDASISDKRRAIEQLEMLADVGRISDAA